MQLLHWRHETHWYYKMKIHFPQQSKTVEIAEKTRLSTVIREHFGNALNMACGGRGTCGKCAVRLGDGRTVLACKTDIEPEMTVFLEASDAECQWEILNSVSTQILKKTGDEPVSDELSFAFDIGTTTLAGRLLEGKSVVASASRPNPQRCFGADVISRIEYGMSKPTKIRELQRVLLSAIREMMTEMLENRSFSDVKRVVFAGNTTMEETLLGLSLASLATSPFLPNEGLKTTFSAGDSIWNGEFSFLPSEAKVRIFPVIGGFVGGDITAGILATTCEIKNTDGASFLLDLGTNGEMVLETSTKRIACATAAGPCFEGAKISCGMCATAGAATYIENRDGDFFIETIRNAPIRGICGSALIDLVAETLRLGILTVDGRLLEPKELTSKTPSAWAKRVIKMADSTVGFQLAPGITVTQEDFRELQLAVGAIRTGIRLLFKRGDATASDIAHFRIAGGFGQGIRMRNARKIGLIPTGISEEKLEFIGNSSLSGAILATVSEQSWTLAQTISNTTQCMDLALDPSFSDVFMDSMFWEEF